ncbi:hypothetical protein TWF730_008660 [Orbilia blumenaviensis]|uniref:Uncharacterized protein n=1 Tax=Orbilia blumenaviensis TaxID=1796055 RepID=A0AAV9V4M3_9PEZI
MDLKKKNAAPNPVRKKTHPANLQPRTSNFTITNLKAPNHHHYPQKREQSNDDPSTASPPRGLLFTIHSFITIVIDTIALVTENLHLPPPHPSHNHQRRHLSSNTLHPHIPYPTNHIIIIIINNTHTIIINNIITPRQHNTNPRPQTENL